MQVYVEITPDNILGYVRSGRYIFWLEDQDDPNIIVQVTLELPYRLKRDYTVESIRCRTPFDPRVTEELTIDRRVGRVYVNNAFLFATEKIRNPLPIRYPTTSASRIQPHS